MGSLSALHWIGISLAAITGGIHLWLGLPDAKAGMIVAGLGFAVGVVAVLLDVRREGFVRLGIPFVGGQILLYALAHGLFKPNAPTFTLLGLVDKAVQGALVGVLVVLARGGD